MKARTAHNQTTERDLIIAEAARSPEPVAGSLERGAWSLERGLKVIARNPGAVRTALHPGKAATARKRLRAAGATAKRSRRTSR